MKSHRTATCERCENVGKHRWIDDLIRFRITETGVSLCNKCYAALRQADARAWEWFRKYRDRKLRSKKDWRYAFAAGAAKPANASGAERRGADL